MTGIPENGAFFAAVRRSGPEDWVDPAADRRRPLNATRLVGSIRTPNVVAVVVEIVVARCRSSRAASSPGTKVQLRACHAVVNCAFLVGTAPALPGVRTPRTPTASAACPDAAASDSLTSPRSTGCATELRVWARLPVSFLIAAFVRAPIPGPVNAHPRTRHQYRSLNHGSVRPPRNPMSVSTHTMLLTPLAANRLTTCRCMRPKSFAVRPIRRGRTSGFRLVVQRHNTSL